VRTEVVELRPSRSRTEQGIARFRHVGRNQDGVVVIEFERTALMLRRPDVAPRNSQHATPEEP
jgi:acyl dehydratase